MKKIILILISILFLSSCEKPRIYIYEYHWKESRISNWNSYNFYVDDVLSDGGIEVFRQTNDNKVIEQGLSSTGLVWQSYVTYCCSEKR
jgi:hypothetical protein